MRRRNTTVMSVPGRLLIGAGVLACLVLGMAGLVLPVIPGLLFLAVAVLITARHVPWVDRRMRAHAAIGPHMDRADRFFRLGFADKVRVAGLVVVKGLLDALDRIGAALAAQIQRDKTR